MTPIDAIGWIGSALIVLAYVLVTRGGMTIKVQAINFAGALALLANAAAHHSSPLVALNLVWLMIASIGISTLAWRARPHQWHATRAQRKAVLRELAKEAQRRAIDEHLATHARMAWGQHLGWLPEGQGDLPTTYPSPPLVSDPHFDEYQRIQAEARRKFGLPPTIAPATYATDLPKNFTSLEEI